MTHGTNGYQMGCRCPDCREAHRISAAQAREAAKRSGLAPDDPRHGRHSTYTNWACRCPACTKANSDACKEQYYRRKAS